MSRGRLLLDGRAVAAFDEALEEAEREYLSGVLRQAYQARKGGLLGHVVAVYDRGEARAVDNFLKKYRASK